MNPYNRPTIDDIARLAGVSRTTASMVLNGRAEQYRIAEATRRRVLEVARDNDFLPSHAARTLRLGSSNTLGLLVPELTNYAHACFAQALEPLCHALGYQLLVLTSDDDAQRELAGIEHLLMREVDGLWLVPCATDPERYRKLAARLPLLLVDRRLDGSGLPYVVTAAQQAVAQMVGDALGAGADEAYYLGGQPELSSSIDRLAGFRAALAQAGIAERAGWVRARDYHRATGYTLMRECYGELQRYPRVLFTASLTLLEGALAFISEQRHFGCAPQRLISFDDHHLLDCLPLPIDAIAQDSAALARTALAQLCAMIDGQPPVSSAVPAMLNWRSRKEIGAARG